MYADRRAYRALGARQGQKLEHLTDADSRDRLRCLLEAARLHPVEDLALLLLSQGQPTPYLVRAVASSGVVVLVAAQTPNLLAFTPVDFERVFEEIGARFRHSEGQRAATEAADAQHAVQRQLRRYQLLADATSDIMLFLHADLRIADANRAAEVAYGYGRDELIGMPIANLRVESTRGNGPQLLARAAQAGVTFETEHRRKDNSSFPVEVTAFTKDIDGDRLYLSVVRDITERKTFEKQLLQQALSDSLTGLANRAQFLDRLGHALQRAERHDYRLAVLFLDVDRFKLVNDSLGHAAGDQLLKAVGALLQASVREEDTVARFGGDEFTILLDNIRESGEGGQVAQRILAELRRPIGVGSNAVQISASIGVASGGKGDSPDELLSRADVALYRAKAAGKDGYVCLEPGMRQRHPA